MENEIRTLYRDLLAAWNDRSAEGMAALFREDGYMVGFDGSTHDGPAQMCEELGRIFAHHPTAAFVARVDRVVHLTDDVAVLKAAAGMVPRGAEDINPTVNAIQTLVAERSAGAWRIALFHNTPAAFHGRPELAEALSETLRGVLRSGEIVQ